MCMCDQYGSNYLAGQGKKRDGPNLGERGMDGLATIWTEHPKGGDDCRDNRLHYRRLGLPLEALERIVDLKHRV